MNVRKLVVLVCLGWLAGCADDDAATRPDEAEIPQAGPAAADPGPAPEGQWEPPVEEPDNSNDQTDAKADESAVSDSDFETDLSAKEADATDVSLKLQSWEETEQLIASHQGKVVVVDFWSTSCLPCRREFPHLVELQKNHPRDVACVSVSLDYTGRKSRPPETYRDPVLSFLQEQQAAIDNVLSIDDPDELEQRLELPPIPLVWVFDRAGKRRQTFDNGDLEGEEFTYSGDVIPFVESLLAEN